MAEEKAEERVRTMRQVGANVLLPGPGKNPKKDSSGGEMGRPGTSGSSWPPQGCPRRTCPLLGAAPDM